MKRVAIALPMMLIAADDASAISRYDIAGMSCDRVHAIIQSEGAAILRYRGRTGLPLYDRYVTSRRYCQSSEVTDTVSVPTADTQSCPFKRCIENEFFDYR
jgi:hypothetical protein